MKISNVEMLRDGGSIIFTIADSALAGTYRLQTPFRGEPRPIFRDHKQLVIGSIQEHELLKELRRWLSLQLDVKTAGALHELAQRDSWHNLDDRLRRALPCHRIQTVINCLETR